MEHGLSKKTWKRHDSRIWLITHIILYCPGLPTSSANGQYRCLGMRFHTPKGGRLPVKTAQHSWVACISWCQVQVIDWKARRSQCYRATIRVLLESCLETLNYRYSDRTPAHPRCDSKHVCYDLVLWYSLWLSRSADGMFSIWHLSSILQYYRDGQQHVPEFPLV